MKDIFILKFPNDTRIHNSLICYLASLLIIFSLAFFINYFQLSVSNRERENIKLEFYFISSLYFVVFVLWYKQTKINNDTFTSARRFHIKCMFCLPSCLRVLTVHVRAYAGKTAITN